jgi:hypothetical protein
MVSVWVLLKLAGESRWAFGFPEKSSSAKVQCAILRLCFAGIQFGR